MSRNDTHTITLGRNPTTREKYKILRVSSPDDNVIISAKQCRQLRLVKIIEKPNCPAGVRKLTMITERHDDVPAAPDARAASDLQAAQDAPPVSPETQGNVEDSPTLSGIQIEN
ncbi:hypothetical protein M758_5G066000 [Ceratodon purpureus]|nr:hypothetical protein M758_5G066000 [Ceratodon purpureus]KAG0615774.1 hypothetical protein M758_5G066000 [Ceratodon purpureus]KAG0615775.1 hypothetical protein M758_5G066000 [Ceratodon purpureus]